MNTDKEKDYIKQRQEWDKNSIDFFSNKRKTERERSVVENFLKVLSINYNKDEIQEGESKDKAVDVIFRGCRFQILEIMDIDRKRHKEYKEKYQRSMNAKGVDDFIEPYRSKPPITSTELVSLITSRLSDKKIKKYPPADKQKLDALVYVNIESHRGYKADSHTIDISALKSQCWRSVSLIMGWHAGVFFCNSNAPQFLQDLNKKGIVLAENPLDIWKT